MKKYIAILVCIAALLVAGVIRASAVSQEAKIASAPTMRQKDTHSFRCSSNPSGCTSRI